MMLTKLLFITLIAILPLGQLTRIPLTPTANLYLHDIVIILLLTIWILSWSFNKRPFPRPPLGRPVLFFIVGASISLAFNALRYSQSELLTGSMYLARYIAYTGVYFVTYDLVAQKKIQTKTILNGLIAVGTIIAFLGIIQYMLYPNLRNLIYLGWDPHEYRIFGTFLDSGFIGIILVLTLILITNSFRRQDRVIMSISWITTYISLALTYSRSSYLAFIISFGVYSILIRSLKPFLFASILLILTILMAPRPSPTSEGVKLERTSTINARIQNYYDTAEIIYTRPIVGVGFNTLRYERRNRNLVPIYEWKQNHAAAGADNSLLFVWATTGIIGLTAYLYMWLRTITLSLKSKYPIILISSITAVITHSFFLNTLFYPWVLIWMFLLFGTTIVKKK